jgi:hypothetical protein
VCGKTKVVPPCVDMNIIRNSVYCHDLIFMNTTVQTHIANTNSPFAVTQHPIVEQRGGCYHKGRHQSEWAVGTKGKLNKDNTMNK